MDQALRAPWHALLRYALLGLGVGAAIVLSTLLLGARPASASTGTAPASGGLVGGVVHGLGETVDGVGDVVHEAVAPVRRTVEPPRQAVESAAPAPAPAPAAPAAPVPAPTTATPPRTVPAPAPAAPAPAAPAPAAAAPAAGVPGGATVPPAPVAAAPHRATPATAWVPVGVTSTQRSSVGDDLRNRRGVVAAALRPVTGSVADLAASRPVSTLVGSLDHVVGSVPVIGPVVGDDLLGTVLGPVCTPVDDTLGGVGPLVGSIPGVVDGSTPVLPGGTAPVPGSVPPPADGPVHPVAPSSGADGTDGRVASRDLMTSPSAPADADASDVVPARSSSAASAVFDGPALLVPAGHGPFPAGDGSPADPVGAAGGTGSSVGGSAGPSATATTDVIGTRFTLAAGPRGTLVDDALPASPVGEHDVAPD